MIIKLVFGGLIITLLGIFTATAQVPTAAILIRPSFMGECDGSICFSSPPGDYETKIVKVFIDDEEAGEVAEGKSLRLPITRGEHIIRGATPDSYSTGEQTVKIESDDQKIVNLRLDFDYSKLANAAISGKVTIYAGISAGDSDLTALDEDGNFFRTESGKHISIPANTILKISSTKITFNGDRIRQHNFQTRYQGEVVYVEFLFCRFMKR